MGKGSYYSDDDGYGKGKVCNICLDKYMKVLLHPLCLTSREQSNFYCATNPYRARTTTMEMTTTAKVKVE
jgi:hypothetical protein